jgi:arginyl-tRNA synthetase
VGPHFTLPKRLKQSSDGSSIYLARDVGAAIERYERYQFDKMLYVVSSQQSLHLAQVFKIIEILGYPWAKSLEHVDFGLVRPTRLVLPTQ